MKSTPSIQPHAESYIRELLHHLQPHARHIDPREFLKAFKNSMRLRNIESVDAFVRQHVVDEQRVDRRRATAQIEEFRRLRALVEQVEQQISALEVLANRYRNCGREYRRGATLNALAAVYEVEHVGTQIGAMEEALETKRRDLRRILEELGPLRQAYEAKDREYIEATRNQDPSVGELEAYEKLKNQSSANEERLRNELIRLADSFVRIVRFAMANEALTAHQSMLAEATSNLEQIHVQLADGNFLSTGDTFKNAAVAVEQVRSDLTEALERARLELRDAERAFQGARAALDRVKRCGARVSDAAARLIEQLEEIGIKATPVCDLLTVSDPDWQPAIEAFLGPNRESLALQPGRERDAVRFVRHLPAHERPYGITLIQPAHLRNERWSDPQNVLVGSMLESPNETALTYVRALFGSMRCAATEEELERYPRALTIDGMLSARGGTRPLRLPSAHQLLLGAGARRDHEREATDSVHQAARVLSEVQSRFNALNDLHQEVLANRAAGQGVQEKIDGLAEAHRSARHAEVQIARMDLTTIESLRARREAIGAERNELNARCERVSNHVASLQTSIANDEPRLSELRQLATTLAARQITLCQVSDFDPELLDQQRERFDAIQVESMVVRIERCRRDAEAARERAEKLVSETQPEFIRYIDTHGVAVLEERSDWRLAQKWVAEESARLKESQLVQYREQAEHARNAAEEAFRAYSTRS